MHHQEAGPTDGPSCDLYREPQPLRDQFPQSEGNPPRPSLIPRPDPRRRGAPHAPGPPPSTESFRAGWGRQAGFSHAALPKPTENKISGKIQILSPTQDDLGKPTPIQGERENGSVISALTAVLLSITAAFVPQPEKDNQWVIVQNWHQMGRSLSFPFFINGIFIWIKNRLLNVAGVRERSIAIFSLISVMNFTTTVFVDIFRAMSVVDLLPLLALSLVMANLFFVFPVIEQIKAKYREHVHPRKNLEIEKRKKTKDLGDDLDKLRSTQAALARPKKNAAICTVSAGIGHEINYCSNYGSGAICPLKHSRNKINVADEQKSVINQSTTSIREGITRAVDIIRNIKSYRFKGSGEVLFAHASECGDAAFSLLNTKNGSILMFQITFVELGFMVARIKWC